VVVEVDTQQAHLELVEPVVVVMAERSFQAKLEQPEQLIQVQAVAVAELLAVMVVLDLSLSSM
jgi:hypothetical protein